MEQEHPRETRSQRRQRRLEEAAADLDRQERELGLLFSLPTGLDSLKALRMLFYDRPSFVKGDSHYTAFKEGQRDVVGYILECIAKVEGGDET